jgi:hypothetical protein
MRRRLLVATIALTASTFFPAGTLADAPYRAQVNSGGAAALVDQPASACLGPAGYILWKFSSLSDQGKNTLFAQTSSRSLQARVHGTLTGQFWTSLGQPDDPHFYDGSIVVRLNDSVTPNFPGDPPQGYIAHPVVLDMVPTAGGPTVPVSTEIQDWVVWPADGSIVVSIAMGSFSCA